MIQAFRRFGESWIAKTLFTILILSFGLFFGITDVFRGKDPFGTIATVGNMHITRIMLKEELERTLQNHEMATGRRLTFEDVKELGLVKLVLGRLIDQTLLDQETEALELKISDATVKKYLVSMKIFQNDKGQFEKSKFDQFLRFQRLTEQKFIETLKKDLKREQLTSALFEGVTLPDAYAGKILEETTRKRYGSRAEIPLPPLSTKTDETLLKKFYETHKDKFIEPERRSFSILVVEGKTGEALEKMLPQIDDELASGKTFEEVAKAHQLKVMTVQMLDRSGRTSAGIVSDELARNIDLGKAVLEMGFRLEQGQDMPLNRTEKGVPYTLKVDQITPQKQLSFEEAHDKVLTGWAKLDQISRALETAKGYAAKKGAGLQFKPLPPLSRKDIEEKAPEGLSPQLLETLFTLNKGEAAPVVDNMKVYVVRLDRIVPTQEKADARQTFNEKLLDSLTKDFVAAYTQSLRVKYPIKVNEKALQMALGE